MFLTAPFTRFGNVMGTAPFISGDFGNFDLLPIMRKVKIFKLSENKKDIKADLPKDTKVQQVVIHLFGENLIISTQINEPPFKSQLMYPPMPLSHVTFSARISDEGITELKLSPYKMLLIKPSDPKSKVFLDDILEKQLFTVRQELRSSSQISIRQDNHTDLSLNTRTQPLCTIEEEKENDIPHRLFNSICRPTKFIIATKSWEKLSKCYCSIFQLKNKIWISLNVELVHMNLLNVNICPNTKCFMDSPTRVVLTVYKDGLPCKYLIKFATNDETEIFQDLLNNSIKKCIRHLHSKYSRDYIFIPPHNWAGNEVTFVPNIACKMIDICRNVRCSFRAKEGGWIQFGEVDVKLEVTGPKTIFISTRLVISSSLSSSLEILSIELENELLSFKMDKSTLVFKATYQGVSCQYRLEECGDLENRLLEEMVNSNETFLNGSDELQKMNNVS